MDRQPIPDERLLEALEVCRPGGDELCDPPFAELAEHLSTSPELKGLYDRVQRVDVEVAAAFHEVPIPEGLAERILKCLAAAVEEPAVEAPQETVQPVTPLPAADVPQAGKRVSRRRLLAGVLSTGAALLVGVGIYYWATREVYDTARVLGEAAEFFSNDSHEGGHLLADGHHGPDGYPFSREVRDDVREIRWRQIRGFLGRDGVAYDLRDADGITRATLYVVELEVSDLGDTRPPVPPQQDTANCCVAAWKEGALLYVLVAPGGRNEYRDWLAPPARLA